MQNMQNQGRQFAGEQPIRRFPQNVQPTQGYQQQGVAVPQYYPVQQPVVQAVSEEDKGRKKKKRGKKVTVMLSPELQSAMCEQCPLMKKQGKRGVRVKFSVMWFLFGIIGMVTTGILACQYVIFPLLDWLSTNANIGGGGL